MRRGEFSDGDSKKDTLSESMGDITTLLPGHVSMRFGNESSMHGRYQNTA